MAKLFQRIEAVLGGRSAGMTVRSLLTLFDGASPERGFPALDNLPCLVDWRTANTIASGMLESDDEAASQFISRFLDSLPTKQRSHMLARSVEKATHYKWLLGDGWPKYVVWLHQYKAPELFSRAFGFAASVHNHRYGFSSKVLSGALHISDFSLTANESGGQDVVCEDAYVLREGGVMTVTHEDIHRIDSVERQTLTLIIQGPIMRDYSVTYDLVSGESRHIYDLNALLPQLVRELGSV